ncbi:MAG: polysaccharide export protein [Acidobacteriia bacterium]|nr:polysaccharide export protein [Terriglobia bacterium]
MIQQQQGTSRPAVQVFTWALIFLLLLAPAAFSQQEKKIGKQTNLAVSETNDRIAQLAQATSVRQGDYVIGSGDLLGVDVFDVPELSRDVRVNESGYISLPLMPAKVRAEGLTTFQLQDKLAELLQTNGLVSSPQVSVSLKERNSQPITIIGSVKTPMVIQAVRQTTLLQALSQAGGIADDAGNSVIVTRQAEKALPASDPNAPPMAAEPLSFTINLADLLETGDSRFNIPLLGGDVVSVPRAGIIYVVGAVVRPGGFVMQNDRDHMTTLKMLSLAGGPNNTAKVKDAVILRKNPETGKRDEVPVDLNKVMKLKTEDVTLQASDILFVPDSAGKRALHRTGDIAISLTTGIAIVAAGKF